MAWFSEQLEVVQAFTLKWTRREQEDQTTFSTVSMALRMCFYWGDSR